MNIYFSRALTGAIALAAAVPAGAQFTAPTIRTGTVTTVTTTGAPPTGFKVDNSTPASVSFSWTPPAGTIGMNLYRSTGAGAPWTTLTSSALPASTVTYTDKGGIDYRTPYVYRLEATYSNANAAYVDLNVTLPKPVNPTMLDAKQNGSGQVLISWHDEGAPAYTVFGPGIPNGAATITGALYTVSNLANGNYTWQVAATYPGNITTPASEFPSASTTVMPFSGNYRITILGFSALNPTDDNLLDADGKGDEIMVGVYARLFDQVSGSPMGPGTFPHTVTHGDTQGKIGKTRIQAGTGSRTGGVIKNDVFPASLMQGGIGSPQTGSFPLKVWEGLMTRYQQVLVLYPSIWEIDDAPSRWFDAYLSGLPPRTQDAMNSAKPTGAKIRQSLDQAGISELRGDQNFIMDSWGLNATGDRPIGIEAVPDGSGNNAGGLFDRVIVLTQRKIEEALAAPAKIPNMPAGTIGLSFTEGGVLRVTGTPDPTSWNFPGSYVIYLRVEKY
jgi:hypothetical protein